MSEALQDLSPVERKFVLHWGEMGALWGVNRTVAQIHALLFISPEPRTAESIGDTLGVARSNVSNSLRELQAWGLVRRVHRAGDRRDHFETLRDVWEMFRIIAEERKKREVDPTIAVLQECVDEASRDQATGEHAEARLRELLGFFETMGRCYAQLRGWPPGALARAAGLSEKVRQLVGS